MISGEMMMRCIRCLLLGIVLALSSCASFYDAHENFKEHMQSEVGNRADDPSGRIVGSSSRVAGSSVLPNGNAEIEYIGGYRGCKVFFEVDKDTNIIVGWRHEGSKEDCIVIP